MQLVSVSAWTLNTSCPAAGSRGCCGTHHTLAYHCLQLEWCAWGLRRTDRRQWPTLIISHALENVLSSHPGTRNHCCRIRRRWGVRRPSPGEGLVSATVFPSMRSIHCMRWTVHSENEADVFAWTLKFWCLLSEEGKGMECAVCWRKLLSGGWPKQPSCLSLSCVEMLNASIFVPVWQPLKIWGG